MASILSFLISYNDWRKSTRVSRAIHSSEEFESPRKFQAASQVNHHFDKRPIAIQDARQFSPAGRDPKSVGVDRRALGASPGPSGCSLRV